MAMRSIALQNRPTESADCRQNENNVVYSAQNNMYGGIFVSVPSFTKGFG